jgi:hypothetical protein
MPAKRYTLFGTLLATGLIATFLAACAGTAATSPNSQGSDSVGSSGSATPARTARPGQPPPPTTPASNGTPGCTPARATITARAGDQPVPVCLHPGHTLTITTEPSPLQPWQPMTSTDPAVLMCSSQPLPQGARTATCRALRPGTATVTTITAPFSGDPHGPAQHTWTLTIHVQPAP